MYKLAESIVAIPKLTLGKYLSEGPKAANAVASDVTSVAKIVPTGDITSIGKYLSTTPAVKDATSVANTTSAAPKVTTTFNAVLPDLKLYGNTTALNKGKNPFYDGIDIYEATINGHLVRGQRNFLESLAKVNEDMMKTHGTGIRPSSSNLSTYRTWDMQNDPWMRSNGGRGFAAADPNGKYAFHMKGNAGDFMGNDAVKYESIFHRHGFKNDVRNDRHHFYIPDPITTTGRGR